MADTRQARNAFPHVRRRGLAGAAVMTATAILVAACGSSGSAANGAGTASASSVNAGSSGKKCSGTVTVGIVTGLTGALAPSGKAHVAGAQAAADQINAAGGADGKCVKLAAEDSQFEASLAVTAYRKLESVDHVSAVLVGGSAALAAVAPLATSGKLLTMNIGAQGANLAGISPYIFDENELADYDIKVMASYIHKQGARTLAIGYVNNDTGQPDQEAMKKDFEALGGKVVANASWAQNAVALSSQASIVQAAHPDAIYMAPTTAEGPYFVKQLRAIGETAPTYSYVAAESPLMLSVAGKDAEGLKYTSTHFDPQGTDPATTTFVDAFKASNGGAVPDSRSALAYDAVMTIAKAMNGAKRTTDLRSAVLHLGIVTGVTGKAKFNADGTVAKDIDIKEIRDGQFVTLQTIAVSAK